MLRNSFIIASALFLFASAAVADIVKTASVTPVKVTMDKLEAIVAEKGFKVFARIDHAAGAKSVNQDLRPTELLIFGNPAGGTPLIQAEQLMGLTLPLKVLVWQDADGKVWVGYDDLVTLAVARSVSKDHPALARINDALTAMSSAAAK